MARSAALALLAAALLFGVARAQPAPPAPAPSSAPSANQDAARDLTRVRQALPLRRGARGEAVAALQRALSRVGQPLHDDGVFGARTEQAVRAFQRQAGIGLDGVVGPVTQRALEQVLAPPATQPAGSSPPSLPALRIPPRPSGARSGSEWLASTDGMSLAAREASAVRELTSGNVPASLRDLRPLSLRGQGADGVEHVVVVWVTPDYLAVGDEGDFVRVPLGARAAQAVADAFGGSLPTRHLVDQVWAEADVRLAPRPLAPGPTMRSNGYLRRHEALVGAALQAQARAGSPGLVAGHKKDVVLTDRLLARPDRVAIYGWHRLDGRPIQPSSTVHVSHYADYSHGLRLVSGEVLVDGRPLPLAAALSDPALHPLISGEGPLRALRVPGT